jgi:curved DNA-binding protein CbpA
LSGTKDLYAILGVLPDAEPEVIRAVYLALAKKYHPDTSGSTEDEDKFKEINAAYEILSNPEQRREYDDTRPDENDDTGRYEPDIDDEDLSVDDYQDDWDFAVEYRPGLQDLLMRVAAISPTLSIVFQSTILSNKAFNDADKIADDLISVFMKRYFGSSNKTHRFAKKLLKSKEMRAARELNKAIRIFGSEINLEELTENIIVKYRLDRELYDEGVLWEEYYNDGPVFIEKCNNHYIYRIVGRKYIVANSSGNKVASSSVYTTLENARAYIDHFKS